MSTCVSVSLLCAPVGNDDILGQWQGVLLETEPTGTGNRACHEELKAGTLGGW